MKIPPVNERELAALFDVHRNTVMAWIKDGLPVVSREAARGAHQIDVGGAIRWVRARDAAAAEERLAVIRATPQAEAARTRKVTAEADLAEMAAAERRGALLPLEDAKEEYGRLVGNARERLLVLPAVLVQRGLVPASHEGAVADLVHEALTELSATP